MMNRRQFVRAGALGALLARIPGAYAASFDLIIKGGRVIDPSSGSMPFATWGSPAAELPRWIPIWPVMPPQQSMRAARSSPPA